MVMYWLCWVIGSIDTSSDFQYTQIPPLKPWASTLVCQYLKCTIDNIIKNKCTNRNFPLINVGLSYPKKNKKYHWAWIFFVRLDFQLDIWACSLRKIVTLGIGSCSRSSKWPFCLVNLGRKCLRTVRPTIFDQFHCSKRATYIWNVCPLTMILYRSSNKTRREYFTISGVRTFNKECVLA